jgi:hypothetical protein
MAGIFSRRGKVLLALGAMFCSSAYAGSAEWESAWGGLDTALLAGALTTMAVDWHQTRKITYVSEHTVFGTATAGTPAARSAGPAGLPVQASGSSTAPQVVVSQQRWQPHSETNPVLGTQPSNAEVNRYFLLAIGGTIGAAYVLPTPYRRVFLGAVTLVEARMIFRNNSIGLRLNF